MPVVKVYSTSSPSLTVPLNSASRTIFRFYMFDNNGNNVPITGLVSAQIIISPDNQDIIILDLSRQQNGDFIFFLTPGQLSLDIGQYSYSLFLDSDYVPYVSGILSVGLTIQQDQFVEVWNASRNAVLINGNQYENPQYVDSDTSIFTVETVDGVATIKMNLASPTIDEVYEQIKNILKVGYGLSLAFDDDNKTATIEVYP